MHFRTRLRSFVVTCAMLSMAACGADINDAPPRLIPGGGIGDGDILGLVNVTVIDGDTDEPIANASVLLGEPGETLLEGLTDSAGLAIIKDGALDGPTTITVVADGYVPSTWFGANGANMTVPLTARDATVDIPQATLSGTIEGWNDLPEPPTNHIFVGLVTYSQTANIGDPENELPQGGMLENACVKIPILGGQCNFAVNARTGTVALYAVIADVDTKGTADQTDDTIEVMGGAYKLGIQVEDGVDQSGLLLPQLEAGAMEEITVTTATPPSGLTAGVILGMDLGESGIINAGLINPEQGNSALLPSQVGDFAGATYRAVGFATEENGGAASAIVLRDIVDASAGIDMGDWLDLPLQLAVDGGTFTFTPVAGVGLHTVDIDDAAGDRQWNIALVDGRTSFTLPGLDPDPLPTGELTFKVNALQGDIDLGDFSIDELINSIERTSSNDATFTN